MKFIPLVIETLTEYTTLYKELNLSSHEFWLKILTDFEANASAFGHQSSRSRVVPFIIKMARTLLSDLSLPGLFESITKDDFALPISSLAENWLIYWFRAQDNRLGIVSIYVELFKKAFPDEAKPSRLAHIILLCCEKKPLHFAAYVAWVREIEGTTKNALTAIVFGKFIRLNYHSPYTIETFIELMNQLAAQDVAAHCLGYQRHVRLELRNVPYYDDFKQPYYFTKIDVDLFGIFNAFGIKGFEPLLMCVSSLENSDAHKKLNQFLHNNGAISLQEKSALLQFALKESKGMAWGTIETMFQADAYAYFKQGILEMLLMMREQPLQLSRLTDDELQSSIHRLTFQQALSSKARHMIIKLCAVLIEQNRLVQPLSQLLIPIYSSFDESSGLLKDQSNVKKGYCRRPWAYPTPMEPKVTIRELIQLKLNNEQLMGAKTDKECDQLDCAAASTETLSYLLKFFLSRESLSTSLAFFLDSRRTSDTNTIRSPLLHSAARNPATLEMVINWFKPEVPAEFENWVEYFDSIKHALTLPLLSNESDYLEALHLYVNLLGLAKQYLNEQCSMESYQQFLECCETALDNAVERFTFEEMSYETNNDYWIFSLKNRLLDLAPNGCDMSSVLCVLEGEALDCLTTQAVDISLWDSQIETPLFDEYPRDEYTAPPPLGSFDFFSKPPMRHSSTNNTLDSSHGESREGVSPSQ